MLRIVSYCVAVLAAAAALPAAASGDHHHLYHDDFTPPTSGTDKTSNHVTIELTPTGRTLTLHQVGTASCGAALNPTNDIVVPKGCTHYIRWFYPKMVNGKKCTLAFIMDDGDQQFDEDWIDDGGNNSGVANAANYYFRKVYNNNSNKKQYHYSLHLNCDQVYKLDPVVDNAGR